MAGSGSEGSNESRWETLRLECDEAGVAWLELHRPERKNAIDPLMARELGDALRVLAADRAVRVVVVRGAGGSFCSGGDLAPPPRGDGDSDAWSRPSGSQAAITYDLMDRIYGDAILTLHSFRKPVIAAVEGVAAGAGANLALACDLVYAAEGARFSEIFIRRALTLDCGGSWLLPRIVGLHKAKELALFGEWVDAEEAARIGIVARVFAAADFAEGVRERAHTLAAKAPVALALTKQALNRSYSLTMAEALQQEAVGQAACTSTHDFIEGMKAFHEKREPRFEGS